MPLICHDTAGTPFQSSARELARVIPDARHHDLPRAGHLPSLERPQEISTLLLDTLAADA